MTQDSTISTTPSEYTGNTQQGSTETAESTATGSPSRDSTLEIQSSGYLESCPTTIRTVTVPWLGTETVKNESYQVEYLVMGLGRPRYRLAPRTATKVTHQWADGRSVFAQHAVDERLFLTEAAGRALLNGDLLIGNENIPFIRYQPGFPVSEESAATDPSAARAVAEQPLDQHSEHVSRESETTQRAPPHVAVAVGGMVRHEYD